MKEFFLTGQDYDSKFSEMTAAIDTQNDTEYIINYQSDFANSKIIRDFVGAIFDAFHIPALWRGRFILITDELVNNSIEHGSQSGDINRCIIRVENDNKKQFKISVEVHDTGKGEKIISMEKIKENRTENEKEDRIYMEKRGRGLFHITEKIVDKLTFGESEKGGLMVKIDKCIEMSEDDNCEKKSHENIFTNKNE